MKALTGLAILTISLTLLCACIALGANQNQPPVLEWQKCFGESNVDWAYKALQTADGGYVLIGFIELMRKDASGKDYMDRDALVMKIDKSGEVQWQKKFGGTRYDYIWDIQIDANGEYITAGTSRSNDGTVSGNHGAYDAWVLKIDANGNILWQKCFGGSDMDNAISIEKTADQGYVLAGNTRSNNKDVRGNHGDHDFWIVKLDKDGKIQWQKCLGGTKMDYLRIVQPTRDGGYIAVGYTQSNNGDVKGNHGNSDYWVVKLDKDGKIQWQKCLGGNNEDAALRVRQTADEGYIVAGYTRSNDGDVTGYHGKQDAWLVKLDAKGNVQWQRCLGGSQDDVFTNVLETADGGYIAVGNTSSSDGDVSGTRASNDFWIVKLDAVGKIVWQKCLGGSGDDGAWGIQPTADNGYIVVGYASSNDGDVSGNHGSTDIWVVKLRY